VLFRRSAIAGHLRGGGAQRRRPVGRLTAAPSIGFRQASNGLALSRIAPERVRDNAVLSVTRPQYAASALPGEPVPPLTASGLKM